VLWGKVEDLDDVKENVEPLLEDEFIVHNWMKRMYVWIKECYNSFFTLVFLHI
jgi:hypothetical protein